MGTQGSTGRAAISGQGAGRARLAGSTLIAFLALTHVLAGCSSSFSSSPPPNQTAIAVPPPPNGPAGAASQPAYAPPPSQPVDPSANMLPYPRQSLFQSSPDPQVAAVPHPPGSYTPAGQPYTPPPGQQPAYGAPGTAPAGAQPAAAPAVAAAPAANAPAANADPTLHSGAYPSQSLFDLFTNKSEAQ